MRAVLIGSSGLVLGREYALDGPVVTIGRRDENTIVIKDPTVSRKHAEIVQEGESYAIVDKGSTSGITVNGQLITGRHALRDGDRIGIGSSAVFMIQLQAAEDKTIAFSQQQFADQGKTQFITREMGDPRAMPATPSPGSPPPAPAQPAFRPSEPTPPSATPSFTPPASSTPPAPSWGEPPRAVPDFAPPQPSVDLGGPPLSSQTMPEMPRSQPHSNAPSFGNQPPSFGNPPPAMNQPDFAPRFDAPPPPGGNFPSMSAVSEFAAQSPSTPPPGAAPQFGGGPSFATPPPPSFPQPGNAPAPMMAPPPPPAAPARGGRVGLIIALVIVAILVIIALIVVGLLVTGRLG